MVRMQADFNILKQSQASCFYLFSALMLSEAKHLLAARPHWADMNLLSSRRTLKNKVKAFLSDTFRRYFQNCC